jgi:hypothetical protein
MIVYLSIGNSDDKLSQRQWAQFVTRVRADIVNAASQVHGQWYSLPDCMWQNACWCLEFASEADAKRARETAITIRRQYQQDSVAWAVVPVTDFI